MKTLNINISDSDFIKYNLQNQVLVFGEMMAKINVQSKISSSKKAKFEDTSGFSFWQYREDMTDVEQYVNGLRNPRQ
ncbi:hypothetical protein [Methylocucumis oryzae]|uniref:Uncharacterized protein n=1 Tax=Methylocucumis oryzae TaxID=1632867 RepID=A0A0F3IK92_9GAMM|nr:hypothetical protein [Methylocucumis oryzae]KJV06004.1 hypothetical protein VZ94_14215 [Methylocucumis oryzae]